MSLLALNLVASAFAQLPPTAPSSADATVERFGLVRAPIYDDTAVPGHVLVRGDRWKADFGPLGLAFTPVLGRRAVTNQTHRFELSSITLAGEAIPFGQGAVGRDGATVTLDRGAAREVYRVELAHVEQTFVFDELPHRGALEVRIDVESPWTAFASGSDLRFVSEEFGAIEYGRAFAFDATGNSTEIERTWTGDAIRLSVPADFVADAVLPLTIDPPISAVFTGPGAPDDSVPDVTFDGPTGGYWYVWQDFVSLADADCFVSSYILGGSSGQSLSIDQSQDSWRDPAIASAPGSDRVLVVASVARVASTARDIRGRSINTALGTILGGAFDIDQTSLRCFRPDIGGALPVSSSQAEFCVVWERERSTGDRDIHARLIDADGTFPGSTIFLANSGSDNDVAPAVSKSVGDAGLVGDAWNVAWIRDDDANGWGQPWARRIDISGSISFTQEFRVFNTQIARNVDVTSTMSDALGDTGQRPFLVSFERNVNGGDVYVTLCAGDDEYATQVITEMEDFDRSLAQTEPRIAGDGNNFVLTYTESSWSNPNGIDTDVYMVSGGIGEASTGGYIALGERHALLEGGISRQGQSAVCSSFDGGGPVANDQCLAVWIEGVGTTGGAVKGRTLSAFTVPAVTIDPAGEQYCQANPHGDSADGGRRSSWLSMFGDQSVGSTQGLRCNDMKRDAFAFFLCSLTSGNVNMPGGSAGRLCLGGSIGRVVGGAIGSTGPSGQFSTFFDPLQLPQPNGTVAAQPGETWSFQCWHRDVQNGVPTSNFSNGCRIRFRP
ncbi:MAG: hypothetical protein AAGB93_05305 [Planctomycetota bacterium]